MGPEDVILAYSTGCASFSLDDLDLFRAGMVRMNARQVLTNDSS